VGLGELTNKIKCLDKSPVYRRRPDKWTELSFEHTLDYQDRMMPEVLLVGYRLSNETVERKRGWSRSQLSFDFYMEVGSS